MASPKSLTDISQTTSKKEVKVKKKDFYFTVLEDLNSGLTPKQIAAKYNRSKQNVNFYMSVLRERGHVRKLGYGTWEVTKSGHEARSKKNLWGTQDDKNIEIWRMGYRYRIAHDNPIPGLKPQILRSGGKIERGHVLGCWVVKGKENLDIYGTVSQSGDFYSAMLKALNEIVIVKSYIEEEYKVKLDSLHALKADIIINDPKAKALAEKISEDVGRMRSEFIDAGDSSKTGKPEMEPKTVKTAKSLIELLETDRIAGIEGKINNMERALLGSLPTQNALANSMNMQAVGLLEQTKILSLLAEKVNTLEALKDGSAVKVEITEDTGIFEGLTPFTLEVHEYDLKPPARIVLERDTANALIMNRKAKIV